ncbi:hypothetical protein NMY22_g2554 [Coprinellus aureogranulatus]|nr:hypothetical protein NMY22_g2554 [Coprinellus aureogranulatus]
MSRQYNSPHTLVWEQNQPSSRPNALQSSRAGPNTAHPLAVQGNTTHIQYHGHVFNTTNVYNGPVNNVGHIENAHFYQSSGAGLDALLWNSLPTQRDTKSRHGEYLEGSREVDVQEIMRWISGAPREELVLYVQGPAGVGKSTLARHLTNILQKKGRLAASVFLSAVPSDAQSPESMAKVIARDMGTIHPRVIPLILSAISSCHGAPLKDYLKGYLCNPSCSLRLPHPAIFLLDATDEWEFFDAFFKELESITGFSTTLKFIFLGRSDPRTRGFEDPWIRSYRLEPVSNITMKRYIVKELSSVKWDFGRAPSERQVAKLVELADGLFIWAKVVCSLLKKKLSRSSPNKTLEEIIHSRRSVAVEGGLSELYHQAIVWLFPEIEDQELLRQYLGATLVLQEPLPVDAFSSLTGLPIRIVESIKVELTALQIRQPIDEVIPQIHPVNMLVHLSFLEYLESLSVPPDIAFHISAFESHAQLAESCLVELRKFLPNARTPTLADLSARQKYAIKHMPSHVHRGTPSVEPESDVDWKRTPHSTLLQDMPIPSLVRWGNLLVALALPSSSMADNWEVPGRSRGGLMADIATTLEEESEATLPVEISCLEVAVRLEPGNPHSWSKLGWAYKELARSTRSRDACDRAVQACQNALKVDGISDADKGHMLISLATALWYREDYFGSPHDLEEAIAALRSAVDVCPPGHPDYEDCLTNLSVALFKSGPTRNLHESIQLLRKVLELRPPGHPERGDTLNKLASMLHKKGSPDDLQASIQLHWEALELHPPGHPDRHYSLTSLANSLSATSSPDNLQESICLDREALGLRPPGHLDRHYSLHNLALSLSETGSPDNLQESIRLGQEALELRPPGHPERGSTLNNLTLVLSKTGTADNVQESIRLGREALELRPPGHPLHGTTLNNLAYSLYVKGSPNDLQESICLFREALDFRPPGDPKRANILNNLVFALERRGHPADWDEARCLREEARAV